MVCILEVRPGETIWWHLNVLHQVAIGLKGSHCASVIYVGASPVCAKNEAFARKQVEVFSAGRNAPDFAAKDCELSCDGWATANDRPELGRKQMQLV